MQSSTAVRAPARHARPAESPADTLTDSLADPLRAPSLGASLERAVPLQRAASPPRAAPVQRTAVVQRTPKKQRMIDERGYTDGEAEGLKALFGGWESAWAISGTVTPAFYRRVKSDHGDAPEDQKRIFRQLDEHYYGVLKMIVLTDGPSDVIGLVRRGINSSVVDALCGQNKGPERATVLGLYNVEGITNVSPMARVLKFYPAFRHVVDAEVGAHAATIQSILTWLGSLTKKSLEYLETNDPSFAALRVLQAQALDDGLMKRLAYYSTEDAPGHDTYEQLGDKGNYYRIGHYARHHTLRGMSSPANLPEAKTLWPYETTLADLRDMCREFDADRPITPNTAEYFWFTPTKPAVQIFAQKHGDNNKFTMIYPCVGETMLLLEAAKLDAVKAVKDDWTDWV